MQEIFIDFQKYSSLKIGTKLPVKVFDIADVGAYFSNKDSKITSKKITFFENTTLQFSTPLTHTKRTFLELDSKQWHIIGKANNLLVSPNAKNLAILGDSFKYIALNEDCVEMGASVSSLQAFLFFKKHDLSGLEFLKNLPGNIGALCNMNAGMKQYEIAQILQSLNINGEWIDAKKAGLLYRTRKSSGVIFAARFHKIPGFRYDLLPLFTQMRSTHPHDPSCGSCFKNPPNDYAGRLLELAGMKGFYINNMGFSDKHANFLVNLGGARFEDAIEVIELARQKVYEISGMRLECEVQICE